MTLTTLRRGLVLCALLSVALGITAVAGTAAPTESDRLQNDTTSNETASPCTPISGQTTAAPGTELELVARSYEDGVRLTTEATVDRSGRFFACFDGSGVPRNASLTVSVRGFPDAETFLIGGSFEGPALSATRHANGTVTVRRMAFEEGFVALYSVPSNATGLTDQDRPPYCHQRTIRHVLANWTRVAVSERLGEGSGTARFTDVSAADSHRLLAVSHLDRDRDERFEPGTSDWPYCVGGILYGEVVPDASASAETQGTPDGGSTPTPPPSTAGSTTTPGTDSSGEERSTPDAADTTADGPGFGPVVAALALVVLPLVARRRY